VGRRRREPRTVTAVIVLLSMNGLWLLFAPVLLALSLTQGSDEGHWAIGVSEVVMLLAVTTLGTGSVWAAARLHAGGRRWWWISLSMFLLQAGLHVLDDLQYGASVSWQSNLFVAIGPACLFSPSALRYFWRSQPACSLSSSAATVSTMDSGAS
jgi:uncharacterized membrane protein YhaH (DUF805 family)